MSNSGARKIIVTGGAGFIGSNLCEFLATDPFNEVWSLDNYSTGSIDNHVSGVTYIEGNTKDIDDLFNFSPDIVYHLGEYSRVEQSFDDFETVWEYNKIGTFKVFEFCKKNAVKIVYAGSSTKFGDGGLGRTQSPYGWTKASNTELLENYGNWFGLNYAIVYFYNVYGQREISAGKYATLIALFRDKMSRCQPLSIVSPGVQRRNFTHIADVVNGLVLVGEEGYGNDFGIGHPECFSVLEIAEFFGGDVVILPARRGNRMMADVITEKTRALGWEPKMDVRTYIETLRKNNWNSV